MARVNSDYLVGNLIPLLRRGGIVNWTVSKALGPTHAVVFALILDKIDQHGKAEIYNLLDYFLLRINISEKTLRTTIKKLESEGLINVRRGKGQKNYYSLNSKGCLAFLKTHEKVSGKIYRTSTEGYRSNLPENTNQRVKTKSKQIVSTKQGTDGAERLFSEKPNKLLSYWKRKGLRAPAKESTIAKALQALTSAATHYPASKIKKAIKAYADFMDMPYHRFTRRLSVDEFFAPTGTAKKQLYKTWPAIKEHGSMFAICLHGAEYTQEQFSTVKKANNASIAKLVQKYTTDHTGRLHFTPKNVSLMNGLANNLEEFWNDNNHKFMGHTMRNASRRPGAIVQVYFKYLEEYGTFTNGFKFHYLNSRSNIDNFYEWLIYNDMMKGTNRRARPNAAVANTQSRQHNREGHSDRTYRQQARDEKSARLSVRRRIQS